MDVTIKKITDIEEKWLRRDFNKSVNTDEIEDDMSKRIPDIADAQGTRLPMAVAQKRRNLVMELKVQGYSHTRIAKKVIAKYKSDYEYNEANLPENYDDKSVAKDMEQRVEQHWESDVGQLKRHILVQLRRVESLINAVWERANNGDYKAIKELRQLQRRKSKLLGLDAPERIDVIGGDEDENVGFEWADPSMLPEPEDETKEIEVERTNGQSD